MWGTLIILTNTSGFPCRIVFDVFRRFSVSTWVTRVTYQWYLLNRTVRIFTQIAVPSYWLQKLGSRSFHESLFRSEVVFISLCELVSIVRESSFPPTSIVFTIPLLKCFLCVSPQDCSFHTFWHCPCEPSYFSRPNALWHQDLFSPVPWKVHGIFWWVSHLLRYAVASSRLPL